MHLIIPKSPRLLPPELLPETLWDAPHKTLRLPPKLSKIYAELISRNSLSDLASSRDSSNPPVGGLSTERANQHFAQAFSGSTARAQLVILDPKKDLGPVVESALLMLSGNRTCVTDAPFGAGAASISFLTTLAELRERKILPRLPLDVALLGGEPSPRARELAQQMLDAIRDDLERQAIFLEDEIMNWNVTNKLSTTDLIQKMNAKAATHPRRLVIVANFNEFLVKQRKRTLAAPQLEELFRYASGRNSEALWIEPDMKRATNLFEWVRKQIKEMWRSFTQDRSHDKASAPTSESYFYQPLQPNLRARVKVTLMPIHLGRFE